GPTTDFLVHAGLDLRHQAFVHPVVAATETLQLLWPVVVDPVDRIVLARLAAVLLPLDRSRAAGVPGLLLGADDRFPRTRRPRSAPPSVRAPGCGGDGDAAAP
ncbi:hypothetical protein D9B85_14950, partial [Corynebacterium diphtheriae]